jgi:hypothetical protein
MAKSMDALALQTNMVIEALAVQMNRGRDEIWKDLREWLDCVIDLRYDPPTLCAEPNEFVRLRQSSPPTAGGDLSQARGELQHRCDAH